MQRTTFFKLFGAAEYATTVARNVDALYSYRVSSRDTLRFFNFAINNPTSKFIVSKLYIIICKPKHFHVEDDIMIFIFEI